MILDPLDSLVRPSQHGITEHLVLTHHPETKPGEKDFDDVLWMIASPSLISALGVGH